MQGKFIYVFDAEARDMLISKNYQLLKTDERQDVFVFANKESLAFSLDDNLESTKFVLSDTLTF